MSRQTTWRKATQRGITVSDLAALFVCTVCLAIGFMALVAVSHSPPVITAMDQLGHADYPTPPSVQGSFVTAAIHQCFSFDQNLGLDSHRER
jgi:hypothetical protein